MRGRLGLAVIAILAAVSACGKPAPPPLESVSPLPPPAKPAWISEIAPSGKAPGAAQIRVIFAAPVIPVGELGSASEKNLLAHFQIAPALPGSFVVLTPRMIGFESTSGLPKALRVRVTLTAGLKDLAGHSLARDLAWTFETDPIAIKETDVSPEGTPTPSTVSLRPSIPMTSNARLDTGSLAAQTVFHSTDGDTGASVTEQQNDDGGNGWTYAISPQSDLRKATPYTLIVHSGVMPADGNVPSAKAFSVNIATYSPLALIGAKPTADPMTSTGYPRFTGGDPVLTFNNPLDQKTFAQHLDVQPSPDPVNQLYSLSDDGMTVSINPYALKPNTGYTISSDGSMQDIYGQQLGNAAQSRIATGNLAPYFWAPSGFNMFVTNQNLKLQYSALNLPGNAYRAAYRAMLPGDLVSTDETDPTTILPDPSQWTSFNVKSAPNQLAQIAVPVAPRLGAAGGLLAYVASTNAPGRPSMSGSVALTNLGIFAQWFAQSGTIMVQRLSDGSAVPSAAISIYVMHMYDQVKVANPQPCAAGTTDANGVLTLQGSSLASCYAGNRPADQAPELLTVARSGTDWSFVRTYAWSGAYDYTVGNLDTTWSNGQPISRGTIFSDREMYQPGERGWLTAVCYVLQNGKLSSDLNAQYSLVLTDPSGNKRKLPAQRTNRYATFSFPIDFPKSQALGYYQITATGPSGAQMTGSFRVAEFRPPNFSVDLKLDRDYAAAGQTVRAEGNAQYLFGAPMGGASASVHVTRQTTTFAPKGWDDFTFGRQWFWPDEQPDISGDVSQQNVTLDSAGKTTASIAVPQDIPMPLSYRVDLEATDASHLASSATQTFTALPGPSMIGLRSDWVGTVGAPVTAGVIVTDPNGKAQAGARVHVELQKMEYNGVTQVVEGAESARNQVQYVTAAQADVTTGSQAQNVALVPKEPGSYRIRANFSGAGTDNTATDAQVWITGPGQAVWGDQNPAQLQMKLDRQLYAPGDTATVAVASPYDRADLYLSVVRDRVLYKTVVHINGTAPKVRVPVTQAMFPNAAVEGVLVRRGAPLTSRSVQRPDSLVRLGMIPIALDLKPRYLRVSIAPGHAKVQPAARQTLHLQLRDPAGRPAQGEFMVIVADDAVLRLSGYRPPDLVQTVFAQQPISMRYADNRPRVTLTQPSDVAQKGWGYGGGFLAGAASTRVRTKFVPLAYFNGSVQTGTNGAADVSFTVPDNLTTWRVMAVATTGEAVPRFGNNDTTFIATKPLVTDALLPQFARSGDQFDGGLFLLNGTSGQLDARTEGTLTGALSFTSPAGRSVQAQQSFGPGMNAWRFGMSVGSGDSATVQFRTLAGSSDAFRVPFAVRNTDVTESAIDSGAAYASVEVPLQIGNDPGSVKVDAAGSLIPQVVVPVARALSADKLELADDASGRLSIAASLLTIQTKLGIGLPALNPVGEATAAIARLASLQRIDGGFAFWPGAGSSDAFGSLDALQALGYAQTSGIAVPQSLLSRAHDYAVNALADPARADRSCRQTQCKLELRFAALQALAAAGDRRTDFLQDIYARRSAMDMAAQAALGVYLQQTPGWTAQAGTIAQEISQRIYVTGRYANVNSDTASSEAGIPVQAAYLELLAARGAPAADQDRAFRALYARTPNCWSVCFEWPESQALRATAAYASRPPAPNFTLAITVDGKTAGTAGPFTSAAAEKTLTLPPLSAGRHTLVLRKTGSGVLHYVVSYTYKLGAEAPGRLNGLRVTRIVHPANESTVLATIDIAAQSDPLSLPAGNVYDIGVQVAVDHPVDRVLITDPLPAGFEALDTAFQTTASYYQPLASAWQVAYQQIYRDRIVAYAPHLDPGVYVFHYLARGVTPGQYLWPGTNAYLLNAPEQFGRSAFRSVKV